MHLRLLEKLGLLESNPTESSSYAYTNQPTDDIDVVRLLEGKPDFYRLPAKIIESKKKHIIITNALVAYGLNNGNYYL